MCAFLRKKVHKNFLKSTIMYIKKTKALALIVSLSLSLAIIGTSYLGLAFAADSGSVVINEIAWAGSVDNSNDEWIELYNTTSSAIDLTDWIIEDDYSSSYVIESGSISPHGYFLIEDSETSVSNVNADAIVGLSLANSGDTLILKSSTGDVVDSVNASGGVWYAGDNTSKATMERIDPAVMMDSITNFATAAAGNGGKGSMGTNLLGTPKGQNSSFSGAPLSATSVEFNLSNDNPLPGETITATVIVSNVTNLFAYGFDVVYDEEILQYETCSENGFLSGSAPGSTSFNAALLNNGPGTLIVGNAKLGNLNGVSGSGDLFSINFKVLGAAGSESNLTFGLNSFLATGENDIQTNLKPAKISIGSNSISSISGLATAQGTDLYSLKLTWSAPTSGADTYIIERKNPSGTFVQIGTTTSTSFVDSDATSAGGKIIPQITYYYRVKAVKNGIQSQYTETNGEEVRGIVGDNDRSGRVDGRDIESLAKKFGLSATDPDFDPIVDTNYDGMIDGEDLIDIGANFGLTYNL